MPNPEYQSSLLQHSKLDIRNSIFSILMVMVPVRTMRMTVR